MAGAAEQLEAMVGSAAQEHGLDPELLRAMVMVESSWNPKAVHKDTKAAGLLQLMPATARYLGVQDPLDPMQNAWGAAKYLKELHTRFGGDVRRAVAAYNQGPTSVAKRGVSPAGEAYFQRVTRAYADRMGAKP